MTQQIWPSRILLFTTFGIYAFLYPSSIILLILDAVPPNSQWIASLLLILEGMVATSWLGLNYGYARALAVATVLLSGAFGFEAIGVASGFPFGSYVYTAELTPQMLNVPIAISFAWLMIVVASYFTVRLLYSHLGSFVVIGLSVTLAVLSDFLMEPVAVYVQKYWIWQAGGFYYGVPLSNFVAWFVIGLILMTLLSLLLGDLKKVVLPMRFQYPYLPLALFLMNLVMFGSISLSHGYWWAGAISLSVGLVITVSQLKYNKLKLSQEKSFI